MGGGILPCPAARRQITPAHEGTDAVPEPEPQPPSNRGLVAALIFMLAPVALAASCGGCFVVYGLARRAAPPPNAVCPVCRERFHIDRHSRAAYMFDATCPYCGNTMIEPMFPDPALTPRRPASWPAPADNP